MARFIQADFPTEHAGVARFTRGFATLRSLETTVTHPVLAVLAVIGAPLTQRVAAWSQARKQRAEDNKMWALALTDARVMADLSRAMSAEATRSIRTYY